MTEKPPLRREEVQRILGELEPLARERRIVLIGGQAVAFWAAELDIERSATPDALFTSTDIDFEGSAQSARAAAELLGGEVYIPDIDRHTPNVGLVVFEDSDGIDREVDFLEAPRPPGA